MRLPWKPQPHPAHQPIRQILARIEVKVDNLGALVGRVLQAEATIQQQEEKTMGLIDDLTQEVANEKTVVDSLDTAVDGIVTAIGEVRQQLQDAINAGGNPAAIQAAVDALKGMETDLSSQKDKLVAAAATPPDVGTPPAPATP